MKKALSVLLALALLFGLMSVSLTVNAATYSERENNNSYQSANTISVGNAVSGSLSSYSDYDYFKIVAPDNGKISISFCHTYVESYNDWNVYVYRYSGGNYNELSSTNIDLNGNEKVALPYIGVVKNGVYYVKVSVCCSGVVGKKYTLTTSFAKSNCYEKEVNDVYSSATSITLGNTYHGVMNRSGDKDYYKITASANGKIWLNFCHKYVDSYDDWDVYIYRYYNGEYHELSYYNIDLNGSEKVNLPFIGAVKGGVYYIKVSVCCSKVVGKDYSIQTGFKKSEYYERESNNVYSKSNAITQGGISYNGVINSTRDKDYYKVISPVNGAISVDFIHSYVNSYDDWNVDVYKYSSGEYKRISGANIDLRDASTIRVLSINAKKGAAYYVVVSCCCSGVVGRLYSLRLNYKQPATGVKLNTKSVSISCGKTYTLKATVSPSNASNKTVKWSSSNSKVATVSSSGKIKALKKGTATITCTTSNGKKATCKVTVIQPATGVKLNTTKLTLTHGHSYTLKAKVLPSNANNKTVTWSSSNSKIAKVGKYGKVTGIKKGTVTITCKTSNGKKATCKVIVK